MCYGPTGLCADDFGLVETCGYGDPPNFPRSRNLPRSSRRRPHHIARAHHSTRRYHRPGGPPRSTTSWEDLTPVDLNLRAPGTYCVRTEDRWMSSRSRGGRRFGWELAPGGTSRAGELSCINSALRAGSCRPVRLAPGRFAVFGRYETKKCLGATLLQSNEQRCLKGTVRRSNGEEAHG